MSIVSAQQLVKCYGAQDVFANVDLSIAHGDKIALVGPNGSGKTTLLRIIVGLEDPTDGKVFTSRSVRMGYVPQKPEFPGDQTLHGAMLSVFADLRRQQQAVLDLAKEMASAHDSDELMIRYAEAEQRFELAGGYEYENRIRRVLSGLGFGPGTYDWPVSLLSGGQVTRALLARLLLEEPDLLVLDEPTNHLDLAALEWLESYLQEWPQSMLIVSHDRYFLDKVVSRVWELDHGQLQAYRGNYTQYAAQRWQRLLRFEREYQAQQEFIAKTEEFIRRYKAGQRSKEARGRETRLRRLERIRRPSRDRQMRLGLSTDLRSGDNVLMSDGALIGYEARPEDERGGDAKRSEGLVLFDTGGFLLQRGERVALLGPNGCGKTTFLRTVLGQIQPLSGLVRVGASVRVGYLPQEQDWLDQNNTVLDEIFGLSDLSIEEARHLLGRYLFSGDDVFKKVGALSGGELSRLALATLAIGGPNLLLLDEPTLHLDVSSQEVLQNVLLSFNGTLLFVSHDRYFIDALATHVWVIEDGRMHSYEGNYSSYLSGQERRACAQMGAESRLIRQREERRRGRRRFQRIAWQQTEQLLALEADIDRLEREIDEMIGMIDQASASRDVLRVHSLGLKYQELERVLSQRMSEWERLAMLTDGN